MSYSIIKDAFPSSFFVLTYNILYVIIYVGGDIMLAVNYSNLRDNLKKNLDQVTEEYETIIVTRKNNRNVVMMSEESYNNMLENLHVLGTPANYKWLMESKAQLEKGLADLHDLIEV